MFRTYQRRTLPIAEATTIRELPATGGDDASAILAPQRPTLTSAGLRAQTEATVEALNALGIGRNDRVAIVLPNGPEMAVAFVAIARGDEDRPDVAQLPLTGKGTPLLAALRDDPNPGPFICIRDRERRDHCAQTVSKENGFDVEGLAVHGCRLFLGLRGPLARGWALPLELEMDDAGDGRLCFSPTGNGGRLYRKPVVELGGMGMRDLVRHGDELLLLAGPTMDVTGLQSLLRFRDAADLDDDRLSALDGDRLSLADHLPLVTEGDKAEGLCLLRGLDRPGLLVVYNAPRADRRVAADAVLADLFSLP